jgi:phosphoglycerol transferase
VTAGAFGPIAGVPIRISVGSAEQDLILTQQPGTQTLEFSSKEPSDRITFSIPNSKSPKELGLSDDPRKIGMGSISLEIKP